MNSTKKGIVLAATYTLLFAIGCATVPYAREVKKKSAGGVVALRVGFTPEDRAKADSIMRANCGSKQIKVSEEGEVTVGQKTNAQANTNTYQNDNNRGAFGWTSGPSANTSSTTETIDMKEWQISYDCVSSDKKS